MMVEATGYHACQEACHELGGAFSPHTIGMRGHLGAGFLTGRTALGLLADMVYLAFFVLNCCTLRNPEDAQSLAAVARRYLTGSFVWDLLGAAPCYWLPLPSPWWRGPRLLNVMRHGLDLEILSEMSLITNAQLIRIFKFVSVLVLYMHMMTCSTMLVAWCWLTDQDEMRQWLDIASTDDHLSANWWFFYLHCGLWVWSNVSGWGGNWSPHSPITSGWTYINQFIGVFLFMYLFGEIVSLLQNIDLVSAEFCSERDKITRFLQLREIPPPIQQRVFQYLDAVWRLKHGVDERALMDKLPTFLRYVSICRSLLP